MSSTPTLVFVPGAWHKAACYDKVIKLLQDNHNIKCIAITLPSTTGDPNATFKDDLDAARNAIIPEISQGRDVIIIAHSYDGMVGNSAVKGLTRPNNASPPSHGFVIALVLIASGFTIAGLSFMDPFFGRPPPIWVVDKETGFAKLVVDVRQLFYNDLDDDEATYWANQLTTHSLKSLFEGGEYTYAGWHDVPTWYLGTTVDTGFPLAVQRLLVGFARGQGAEIYHREVESSHSPFLSRPEETVAVIMEAVRTVDKEQKSGEGGNSMQTVENNNKRIRTPALVLTAPRTWINYGLPSLFGRIIGWGVAGFIGLRRLWRQK